MTKHIPKVPLAVLLALTSVLLIATVLSVRAQSLLIDADHPFRVLVIGQPGQAVAFPIDLFHTELERHLKKPLVIEYIDDTHLDRLRKELFNAEDPDDTVAMIADLDWLAGRILYGFELDIEKLTPVARVSAPLTLALVITESSAIDNWQELVSFSRNNELRLAEAGDKHLAELLVDLVEWQLGKRLARISEDKSGIQLMEAIRSGEVHAVFAYAYTLERFNRAVRDHVVPLITFGSGRSNHYPWVPTFSEIASRNARGEHLGLIDAISVFAPPSISVERARELSRIFQKIASDSLIRKLAERVDYPIRGGSPNLVRQTLDRNRKILERLKPLLVEQ